MVAQALVGLTGVVRKMGKAVDPEFEVEPPQTRKVLRDEEGRVVGAEINGDTFDVIREDGKITGLQPRAEAA
jgi:hypothetical protein